MKYPHEHMQVLVKNLRDCPETVGFMEGAAYMAAMLMTKLSGDSPSGKSYDPLTVDVDSGIMLSYAFDLKNGGRQHPLGDYEVVSEVVDCIFNEAVDWIGCVNNELYHY